MCGLDRLADGHAVYFPISAGFALQGAKVLTEVLTPVSNKLLVGVLHGRAVCGNRTVYHEGILIYAAKPSAQRVRICIAADCYHPYRCIGLVVDGDHAAGYQKRSLLVCQLDTCLCPCTCAHCKAFQLNLRTNAGIVALCSYCYIVYFPISAGLALQGTYILTEVLTPVSNKLLVGVLYGAVVGGNIAVYHEGILIYTAEPSAQRVRVCIATDCYHPYRCIGLVVDGDHAAGYQKRSLLVCQLDACLCPCTCAYCKAFQLNLVVYIQKICVMSGLYKAFRCVECCGRISLQQVAVLIQETDVVNIHGCADTAGSSVVGGHADNEHVACVCNELFACI